MEQEATLNTFGIKMTIIQCLGENASKDKAEELFNWVMDELERIDDNDGQAVLTLIQ